VTEPHIDYERIGRMVDERVRETLHGNGDGITIGSIWSAFIDFRQEVRIALKDARAETATGFETTHAKQDKTNGTLKRHEWQIAFASGGVAVISFFAGAGGLAYLLVRLG